MHLFFSQQAEISFVILRQKYIWLW